MLYLSTASTLDNILFFTNRGRVYQERAFQVPDAGRQGKGMPLVNLLALERGELVTAVLAVPGLGQAESSARAAESYLTMVTQQGRIKRTALAEFGSIGSGNGIRPSGLIAINLVGATSNALLPECIGVRNEGGAASWA